jgi:hypothetical protein
VVLYLLSPMRHRFPFRNQLRLSQELFSIITEFYAILILKFLAKSGYVHKQ